MPKSQIIVRNITHLTDARYFAAMEVDWISMVLTDDPVSFSKWHAVRDWISGVRLAAELSDIDESLVAKTIIEAAPDGVITDNLDIIHLTGGIELFIVTEKLLTTNSDQLFMQILPYSSLNPQLDLSTLKNPELIYLEANWTPQMITDLKNKNYSGGICFTSGTEIATGLKDFSEMDEMIELLRG